MLHERYLRKLLKATAYSLISGESDNFAQLFKQQGLQIEA
jgi:hypothetical protein